MRMVYMCRECHKCFVWAQDGDAVWNIPEWNETRQGVRHPQCLTFAVPAPDEVQAVFRIGGMRAAKEMLPGYTIYGTQPQRDAP